MQYKIPNRMDIPSVRIEFESSYEKTGPFGAKSIGELVIDTPCPAIANAVYNATGVRVRELPITPEKVAMGILAMEAGADYIAPYFNRMENMGIDPDDVIASFAEMIGLYGYHTQILGASFKNAGQVDRAFLAGAQTATMDPSILSAALTQAHILKAVDDFDADWKSVYGDVTISELQ